MNYEMLNKKHVTGAAHAFALLARHHRVYPFDYREAGALARMENYRTAGGPELDPNRTPAMKSPDKTSLVIGCCEPSSHRARAVPDGTLAIPNCTCRYVKLGPGEMLHRSFDDPQLNLAEWSLSSCITRIARSAGSVCARAHVAL